MAKSAVPATALFHVPSAVSRSGAPAEEGRGPAPSTVIAGPGETRQQSSNADGAFTGVPEGGEEQTSVPVLRGPRSGNGPGLLDNLFPS